MELVIKAFHELSVDELYEIIKLRVDVFVVEQQCPYREVDDVDKVAYHVYLMDEEGIQAYLRVIPKGAVSDEVMIGRVIARKRRCGLGTRILLAGIDIAVSRFHADVIAIEAQTYARALYEKVGFVQTTDEYMLDGIPHIGMKWNSDRI